MRTHRSKMVLDDPLAQIPIDIIIPFHTQYEKVHKAVDSIWRGVKSNPYQMCLVDDCSPNKGYVKLYENSPRMAIVQLPSQMGFGAALQAGFMATNNPFVAFVHSDCVIEPHCFYHLSKLLIQWESDGVGMVSARTNNPGDGAQRLHGRKGRPTKDFVLEEEYLPLYCALCRRSLFSQIGGFVKPYPFGYYEDEELAHRMKHFGFKQAVSGRAWVDHVGGATFDALAKSRHSQMLEVVENNRERCLLDMAELGA